jgi:hypothetical protein
VTSRELPHLGRRRERVSARCTAILDSVDFPRTGGVAWDESVQSYVVPYRRGDADDLKFLGPTDIMALTSARRERAKALAPARRASAREGLAGFLEVVGAVTPLVGTVIGGVARRVGGA